MTDPTSPGSLPLLATLRQPVDGAALAVYRIAFAALVLVYLALDVVNVVPTLSRVAVRFTYTGFAWVPPLPADMLYAHYAVLALLTLCVGLGVFYRLATCLLAAGYAYVFLLEPTWYSNNTYFLLLAMILLCLVPAHRAWSLDARRSRSDGRVPRWAPLSVAVLSAVPLVYMGVTRLNADWLDGYPLRIWFKTLAPGHELGLAFSNLLANKWMAVAWSYLGLVAHLAVIPLLLWRPARWLGALLLVVYYAGLTLAYGKFIFPLPPAVGLVVFFAQDWPRRALARLRKKAPAAAAATAPPTAMNGAEKAQLAAVAAFLAFHVLFPARALLYPGVSAWTGDGYRYAWRTMLDDKHCEADFSVYEPATGKSWSVNPRELLRPTQLRELHVRPELMVQFARFTAERFARERKVENPEVRARAKCSLNSRPYGQLFDARLDLSKQETPFLGATGWIVGLDLRMHRGWRVVGPGR